MVIPHDLSPRYLLSHRQQKGGEQDGGWRGLAGDWQLQDADCSFPAETCSCLYAVTLLREYRHLILRRLSTLYFVFGSNSDLDSWILQRMQMQKEQIILSYGLNIVLCLYFKKGLDRPFIFPLITINYLPQTYLMLSNKYIT